MLTFNDVLRKMGLPLAVVRLLRHAEPSARPGRTPYELWRDQRELFDRYQSEHGPNAHSKLQNAEHWASFVALPSGETMFVGMYVAKYIGPSATSIVDVTTVRERPAGSIHLYDVSLQSVLSEYAGRLLIDWGPGTRAWVQRADQRENEKPILELRRKRENPFPGFANFVCRLSSVEAFPETWQAALAAARGIYVLTCPRTRELYVGSAYGEGGFLARWIEYARTGHGGNVQLKSRETSDYQISILEIAGSTMTDTHVIAAEQRWKEKLQTREMGLNSN